VFTIGTHGAQKRRQTWQEEDDRAEAAGYRLRHGKTSIHDDSCRDFLVNYLGAGSWQQTVLEKGYMPNFKQTPDEFRARNNKSARDNMSDVTAKLQEWLENGHVEEVKEAPRCVNPLTVAEKKDRSSGNIKKRVCLDTSRSVNPCLHTQDVKLDTLESTEALRQEGNFMEVFDLENQFFHVRLHEEARQFFGFMVEDEEGHERFYRFLIMPYGFAPAVAVVDRLIKPIKSYLHQFGIRTSMYVDDGQVIEEDKETTEAAFGLVLNTFWRAGWNVQWKKTSTEAQPQVDYLGVVIDGTDMTYRAGAGRIADLEEDIGKLLRTADREEGIQVRQLAGVLGTAVSLRDPCGKMASMVLRQTQHTLGLTVAEEDWEAEVAISYREKAELSWVKDNMRSLDGQPIRDETAETVHVGLIQTRVLRSRHPSEQGMEQEEAGGYVLQKDGRLVWNTDWDESDGNDKYRQAMQELKAIQDYLMEQQKGEGRWRRLVWKTDSRETYNFLNKGTRDKAATAEIVRIKWLEKHAKMEVKISWDEDDAAELWKTDVRSRLSASTDEWGLKEDDRNELFRDAGLTPTIDAFASSDNKVCDRFFSKWPQMGGAGTDFFTQQLQKGEVYYCCPPVKEAGHMFRKLLHTEGVTALVVVPAWESATFWPLLKEGDRYRREVKWWRRWKPGCKDYGPVKTLFTTRAGVEFLAALLQTGTGIGYSKVGGLIG